MPVSAGRQGEGTGAFGAGREMPSLDRARSQVAGSVAGTIITRLIQRYGLNPRTNLSENVFQPTDVDHLSQRAMQADFEGALDLIDRLCTDGASLDAVFMDLMVRAARHMEALWAEDGCTSTDLTIGQCQLRLLVCRLLDRAALPVTPQRCGQAVVVSMPGDQASFDPMLHQLYLTQAGWQVDNAEAHPPATVVSQFRRESIDLALVSIVKPSQVERVARLLSALRGATRNPGLRVLLLAAAYTGPTEQLVRLNAEAIVYGPLETLWQAEWCRPQCHQSGAMEGPMDLGGNPISPGNR